MTWSTVAPYVAALGLLLVGADMLRWAWAGHRPIDVMAASIPGTALVLHLRIHGFSHVLGLRIGSLLYMASVMPVTRSVATTVAWIHIPPAGEA